MLKLGICVVLLWTAQTSHGTNERGEMVMGFDQAKTAHHFLLYNDGGAIDIVVKSATDAKDLAAIRSHLPHIAMMFGDGNFDAPMLVHDTKDVPGIKTLAARKDQVRYAYVETPDGGRVNIVTTDPVALTAIHDFLKYQIKEHQTADSGVVMKRP
jgi:hypothetical protein